MKKNKRDEITGNCSYCKEKAVAFVRGKKLCSQHFAKFKKGELYIPLSFK